MTRLGSQQGLRRRLTMRRARRVQQQVQWWHVVGVVGKGWAPQGRGEGCVWAKVRAPRGIARLPPGGYLNAPPPFGCTQAKRHDPFLAGLSEYLKGAAYGSGSYKALWKTLSGVTGLDLGDTMYTWCAAM